MLSSLDDMIASTVWQNDGTVLYTHELLSPVGNGVEMRSQVSTINFYLQCSLAAFDFPQINCRTYNGKKYSTLYGATFSLIHGREAVSLSYCTYLYSKTSNSGPSEIGTYHTLLLITLFRINALPLFNPQVLA